MRNKILLTLLFTIGLLLLWYNISYCATYTENNLNGSYSFFMDDDVLRFLYDTTEYKNSTDTYHWFVILNNNTSCYEIYFTPWASQTPIQAYLSSNRWYFNGTFDYIKYSCPLNSGAYWVSSNWTRTTGTISRQNLYVYKDNSGWYSWSADWSIYFYFVSNVGGWITFPQGVSFLEPTIYDGQSSITVTTELGGVKVYGGEVPATDNMTIKFYYGNNNTSPSDLFDAYTLNENSGWYVNTEPSTRSCSPSAKVISILLIDLCKFQ